MVDPDHEPDDLDFAYHETVRGILETIRTVAVPEGLAGFPGALDFPRGMAYVVATIGLLIDMRLAMNERNRG